VVRIVGLIEADVAKLDCEEDDMTIIHSYPDNIFSLKHIKEPCQI